jgi:LuxR family transcriptional regulator, maltose regulon positive regulatory protein
MADRTEGWAAGLQLAALSLPGQPDVARFVAAFTGSHRYVLDHLTEEVLERLPRKLWDFLLETSVLERLSGSLCDAVTGREDSQDCLEEADRSGLFLIQLDNVRGWWRYHHLFADLLRARLERDPERTRCLHRNAAWWYEQHELPDEAIHHALAAGEQERAARLIEEHFDQAFSLRGEQATIQRWLPALPGELVRSRPRLLLAQAQMASMHGDLRTVEPLLDAAEQVIGQVDEEPFTPSTGPEGSLLVNARAMLALQRSYAAQLRGDARATATFTRKAAEYLGQDELMLASSVQGFQAMPDWLRGQLADAETAFESSIGWWRREGQVTTTAWGYYCLARLQRGQGRLDAAVRTCERALEAAGQPGRRPPAAGLALIGLADVAYQRHDLDRAGEYLDQGIWLCRQFVHTPPLAAGLVTKAWICQATGDPPGAGRAMTEAMSVCLGPSGLLNPVPAQRARLLLAQGDVARAARWAAEAGLRPGNPADYPREAGYLVLAALLQAQDRPSQALALLDRLDAAASAQRRAGSLIEIGALRAVVLAALGDSTGATAALHAALRLGWPEGYVRVFADEGPAMAAVLAQLIAAQRSDQDAASVPLAYLGRLQVAFTGGRGSGPGPADRARGRAGLIEQLTARERDVLAMLAAGQSNQNIARHLVISLDTVKKHVSHLLAKLGAANRTEAVARGRALGLID